MSEVYWLDPGSAAILTKKTGEKIELSVGSVIRYEGRPDGVKITGFSSKYSDKRGPLGLYYLPWRPVEGRWAEEFWTWQGNARHIMAYPVGTPHYGEHINWSSVELLSEPDLLQINMLLLKP